MTFPNNSNTRMLTFDCPDAHALVYFYQLVSLNVAVNSYDNALLTLLVSNQFVEIKGCESLPACDIQSRLLIANPLQKRYSRSLKRKTCFRSCVRVGTK